MDTRRTVDVARRVVRLVREENVPFKAGSIAHAAFLSLLPLLLLLLLVAAAVGSDELTRQIVSLTEKHASPAGEGLVYEALQDASGRAGASLIGAVSLVWGMLRIFRGIDTAVDELYGGEADDLASQVANGLVIFGVVVLATVGVSAGSALIAFFEHPLIVALNPLVLLAGLSAAFFPVYYYLPDPDVTPREALPGTLVAAVGWAVLEVVFGVYADAVNTVGTYETLGAVILLLVWLYGNALVLLIGVAVNIVFAGRDEGTADSGGADAPATESYPESAR